MTDSVDSSDPPMIMDCVPSLEPSVNLYCGGLGESRRLVVIPGEADAFDYRMEEIIVDLNPGVTTFCGAHVAHWPAYDMEISRIARINRDELAGILRHGFSAPRSGSGNYRAHHDTTRDNVLVGCAPVKEIKQMIYVPPDRPLGHPEHGLQDKRVLVTKLASMMNKLLRIQCAIIELTD